MERSGFGLTGWYLPGPSSIYTAEKVWFQAVARSLLKLKNHKSSKSQVSITENKLIKYSRQNKMMLCWLGKAKLIKLWGQWSCRIIWMHLQRYVHLVKKLRNRQENSDLAHWLNVFNAKIKTHVRTTNPWKLIFKSSFWDIGFWTVIHSFFSVLYFLL